MHPGSEDPRIEAMFRQDRAWSLVAIIALWLTLVFVFVQIAAQDLLVLFQTDIRLLRPGLGLW